MTARQRQSAVAWYLTASAAGHFGWEMLQLPLYTIWRQGSRQEITLALVHCSIGDVLIAATVLLLALVLLGARSWPREGSFAVAAVTIAFGLLYTAFSEWLNVHVRRSWAYDTAMPTLDVAGYAIGLAPLMQWLLVPSVVLAMVWRRASR